MPGGGCPEGKRKRASSKEDTVNKTMRSARSEEVRLLGEERMYSPKRKSLGGKKRETVKEEASMVEKRKKNVRAAKPQKRDQLKRLRVVPIKKKKASTRRQYAQRDMCVWKGHSQG